VKGRAHGKMHEGLMVVRHRDHLRIALNAAFKVHLAGVRIDFR